MIRYKLEEVISALLLALMCVWAIGLFAPTFGKGIPSRTISGTCYSKDLGVCKCIIYNNDTIYIVGYGYVKDYRIIDVIQSDTFYFLLDNNETK